MEKQSEGKKAVNKFLGMVVPGQMTQEPQQAETVQEVPAEPNMEDQLVDAIRRIDVAPELSYEQRITRFGIDLEEAAKIVDAVLSQGYYERSFPINKRHAVVLRTRGVSDQERLQNSVETQIPRYALTVNEMTSRYNLASSLAEFNGTQFKPNEFKKAYEYVGKLALPVFNALVNRLSKFDHMMYAILDDGAVENF